ncbi:DENN domain-containing protein 5B, partial [Branchiostoma belcheri]
MSEPGQAGTRFADYFVVCGLDVASGLEPDQLQAHNLQLTPLERSYNSKVLAHYPENVAWNPFDESAVGMLCLPKGLSFRTENEKRETRFHSFIITREDGSRTYGTSFTFYEKVVDKQICEAMQTLFAMHKAELSNRQSRTVFPLMDRTPPEIGDENERYVPRTYDITSDVLYVTKSICLITPLPFIQACKKFLSQLYEAISSPSQPPLPVESYVYNILYEVPLPPPGRSLQFNAAKGAVTCHRPSANELPLFDFHIREMFTLLGVDSVLQLWTCALLEKHILLYSQDYHRLMLLAESLSVLLFPFTWQHVYVPILPASLLHFLDAPVPYIMGLHHSGRDDRSQLQLPHEASLCFVDIDNHTVELPEDLPQFPKKLDVLQEISEILVRSNVPLEPGMNPPSRSDSGCHLSDDGRTGSPAHTSTLSKRDILESSEAIAKITAIAQRMGVSHTISDIAKSLPEIAAFEKKPKVDHDLEDMKLNAALREIFLHRIASLLLGYESFVIQPNGDLESWFSNREQMTNFDKAAFLSDQPDIYLPFLSPFIETQMFATLVDNKASNNIMANWEPIDDNLKIFDAKIENIKSSRNSHIRMSNPDRSIMVEIQERAITEKWNKVDHMAVHPHLLSMKIGQGRHEPGFFPDLQPDVMCYESGNNSALQDAYSSFFLSPHADEIEWDDYRYTRRNMRQQWRRKERMQQHSQHLAMSTDQREDSVRRRYSPLTNPLRFPSFLHVDSTQKHVRRVVTKAFLSDTPNDKWLECTVNLSGFSTPPFSHGLGLTSQFLRWDRMDDNLAELWEVIWKYIQEARGKLLRQPKLSDMSPAVIAQTNWKFVEGLLKECKVKTKRMLVEKMGSEAVELGHGETSLRGMEENTLIASLCDLLERIWSHGLQTKQGKSALWSHLMAYQEMEETRDRSPESSALSPGTASTNDRRTNECLPPPCVVTCCVKTTTCAHQVRTLDLADEEEASHDEEDKSYKPKKKNPFKKRPRKKSAEDEGVTVRSSRSTLKVPMASPMMDRRRRSKSPDPISLLPAMKQTVVQDMRSIQSMKEIKTDVGFARTWVRLSIEKKMLSAHLKELLADQELLKSRYKRYAFLRSEEEREQFLYHLLSLNAVDYFCFTNCFTATVIPYRVVIVPSRKFNASTTTAQPWMCLAGEMSDTGIIQLPKNTLEMTFEHKNLGLMTTLRIGHDNSGLMPNPTLCVNHKNLGLMTTLRIGHDNSGLMPNPTLCVNHKNLGLMTTLRIGHDNSGLMPNPTLCVNHKNLGLMTTLRIGHDNSGLMPNPTLCVNVLSPNDISPHTVLLYLPQHKNLGLMTTLRIGHDNSGLMPNPTLCVNHKNLGLMTTLRIGHDNSGLMPKWMVEYILVRNEVTGHTYKFQCGRWLGKGVDDGSLERLLVGELLRKPVDTE